MAPPAPDRPKGPQKLPRLPPTAKITKRPLPRPPIPSKYASCSTPKIVYVSSKTPFLSAVKRVEKLLRQADKRLVQSATEIARKSQNRNGKRSGKFTGGGYGDREDEVLDLAREVERLKRRKGGAGEEGSLGKGVEEVVVKGAGKAIAKVMDLGVWFQERRELYNVRLETSSVGAVDDIEVEEDVGEQLGEEMGTEKADEDAVTQEPIPETRIRYLNVLEVFVSLR